MQRTAAEVLEVLRRFETRGRRFALSVRSYNGPEDLTDEDYEELRSELGLEGETLPPKRGADPLPFGRDWIRARFEDGSSAELYEGPVSFAAEQAWEDAAELVREDFGGRAELVQEGRSGGWAVLEGVDAADVRYAAEDFARVEELRDRLGRLRAVLDTFERGEDELARRLAREHGESGDERADFEEARATLEDALVRHAEEETSGDYAERVRASVELRRFAAACQEYPGPIRGDEDYEGERRAVLGLEDGERVPFADELAPELESVERWTLPELSELADALERFERYAEGSVRDFPRLVAWHAGANVYERELQEWKEEQAEDERTLQRGRAVRELYAAARELAERADSFYGETADALGDWTDELEAEGDALEAARRTVERALEALAEWPAERELSVRLPLSGRRPAVPCSKCGEPVRFKWGSSEEGGC